MKILSRNNVKGDFIKIKNDKDFIIASVYQNKMIAYSKNFFYLPLNEAEFIVKVCQNFYEYFDKDRVNE